jgi:hypothetical protein
MRPALTFTTTYISKPPAGVPSPIFVLLPNPRPLEMKFSDDCLRKGLNLLRYEDWEIDRVCDRTNHERFAAHYGFSPATVAAVLNDNQQLDEENFFMTLSWWKIYDTEHRMNARWKLHPETIRDTLEDVCKQLAKRKADKIVFGEFAPGQIFVASLDCVHFKVQEFGTDPSSKWYSHKHNGPGLTYLMAVDTVKDRIVWAEGPFPAATHDITIFRGGTVTAGKETWRKSSLYYKVNEEQRLVGDSGLVGEPNKISTALGGHAPLTKELFARFKSRGETLFRGYKSLEIMGGSSFRHKGKRGGGAKGKMAYHGLVFDAITVVMQYALETDGPLFDV